MVDAGIEAVLITSPVVTRDKIARVVELARRSPGLQIVVDNAAAATGLERSGAARRRHRRRADRPRPRHAAAPASRPGAPALELLRHIARTAGAALRRPPVLRRQRDARQRLGGAAQALARGARARDRDQEPDGARGLRGRASSPAAAPAPSTSTATSTPSPTCRWAPTCSWTCGYRRCGGPRRRGVRRLRAVALRAGDRDQPAGRRASSPSTPATRRCPPTPACRISTT